MSDELMIGVMGLALAAIPWAMSIHAKVAVICESVKDFPLILGEIRHEIQEHEQRLTKHEHQIQTLQVQARSSH